MLDKDFIQELSASFMKNLPESLSGIKNEIQKHFAISVDNTLNKLNLVTREEFDIQVEILARTRQKLIEIEEKLNSKPPQV